MISTKYIIKSISDVTSEMLSESKQGTLNNCKKNNVKTKCILKWEQDETPEIFIGETVYDHSEIISKLSEAEWISEDI